MKPSLVLGLAAAAIATVAVSPAHANHKKPITKTFTATAPAPDPTNYVDSDPWEVCAGNVPNSIHRETFKAPDIGKLKVELTFTGDWDIIIANAKGQAIGAGTSSDLAKESATAKVKKGETITIVACNWAGTPTAQGKYTFTYAT